MIKSIIFLSLVLFSVGLIIESHQTHISTPVISTDKTLYKSGDVVVLAGLVIYDDKPTSDVLLRILVTDPKETTIFDVYTSSLEDGTFFVEFSIPENSFFGEYKIEVTSLCREVHRDICTHKNEILSITVEADGIPPWIKNNADWWSQGLISDDDFILGLEYLIEEKIMTVPPSEPSTEPQLPFVPNWIKDTAGWWAQGKVTDGDFVNGIQYMISNGYMKV